MRKLLLIIMRKLLLIIMIAFLSVSIDGQSNKSVVLQNANVIDVATGKTSLLNIKLKNGKISKVSSKKIKGKSKIDLKGKYVMPHLWDMHVHFHGDSSKMEKHLKAGVLGVRDMGAFGQEEFDFLKKNTSWKSSKKSIPKTYYAGYMYSSEQCYKEHKSVKTLEALKDIIKVQKKNKLPFFKIHNCFPKKLFPKLQKLAKKEKIQIVGHIPQGFDPIEFAKLGVSSIEHTDIILRALMFRKPEPTKSIAEAIKILEGDYLDKLADVLVQNNVALTPTLVTYENYVNTLPEKQKPLGKALFGKIKMFTKRLSDKGVLLLAGTDLGLEGIKPGKSLIRELELMVESGITTQEALKTAIINPAKYLRLSKSSISKKSKADFIVLEKNPLEKITNLKNIHAIVINGEYKVSK